MFNRHRVWRRVGFGWFADNVWLQGVAIIMPAVANEWRGYPTVRLATLALYAGLIVGALWWGMLCGEPLGRCIEGRADSWTRQT